MLGMTVFWPGLAQIAAVGGEGGNTLDFAFMLGMTVFWPGLAQIAAVGEEGGNTL